jgi:hypothetical protein
VTLVPGDSDDRPGPAARTVRLPGFASDDVIGLGDAIKRATSSMGIRPCGGCHKRAAKLNQRVAFTGRKRSR